MLKIALLLCAPVVLVACGGPPCKSQDDCPFGYYCVASTEGGSVSGECLQECRSGEDCPQPNPDIATAICSNEGRCRTIPRPPRITLWEPEFESVYEEGTRSIRVTGEIETAAEHATVTVTPNADGFCSGGTERALTLRNPNPGTYSTLPFVVEEVDVDSGPSRIRVEASAGEAERSELVDVRVECPGCATLAIEHPPRRSSAAGLELPILRGRVENGPPILTWRVHSATGDIIDGLLPTNGSSFEIERLPLFSGLSRVEVVASGAGAGLGEARCSTIVSSDVAVEDGLRILLFWDGPNSDLDLALVGPGGVFGDRDSTLSARSRRPTFGGTLEDDPIGYGPEVASLVFLPEGEYGVVVEPVADGGDFGTDATLRILSEGRALLPRPIGPRHLSSLEGRMWVPGTIIVSRGSVRFRELDATFSASSPPITPPSAWPTFQ